MPYVTSIHIYPIKSLDGIAVSQAAILASGALAGDRSFAICDQQGEFVNSKRNSGVHFIRFSFDVKTSIIGLKIQGTQEEFFFHIDRERRVIESWFSSYFGFPVKLFENLLVGFPDDLSAPGPTIISTATIAEAASWFPRVCVNEMRQRLRPNIEIGDVPPFWEDKLFAASDEVIRFQIGKVIFEGINPCQHSVIPKPNNLTQEAYLYSENILTAQKKKTMPDWVKRSHFNHLYRLSINTRVPPQATERIVRIGDPVKIIGVGKVISY
jgi:uncharacterized protein